MFIGLTGAIGAGKTTVAELLAQHGAEIIDTDALAREIVQPPSPVLDAIRNEFGDSVIAADGELDRIALARLVFADDAKREKLNELTHPAILKRVLSLMAQHPPSAIVVIVVPLLFEANFERNCDLVIAVVASEETRRRRLAERDGLTSGDIDARMNAQRNDADLERRAHIVIYNKGDMAARQRRVNEVWNELTRRSATTVS